MIKQLLLTLLELLGEEIISKTGQRPDHCDFTASLHKSTVSLLCPPVTIGSAGGGVAKAELAAAGEPVAGVALVAAFFSHPVNVSATQHRPALNKRVGEAGWCLALGEGDIAPTITLERFRRSQLGVRTAEKRKRTGCISLL